MASQAQRKSGFAEVCFVCGSFTLFSSKHGNYREAQCSLCGTTKRVSDVARVIGMTIAPAEAEPTALPSILPELRGMRIFEAQASGPLHDALSTLPGYQCAEFFDDVTPGSTRNGVRCEDLTRLTFPDNEFDLVITQDVLEHVPRYEQAFREIRRVLKPGGKHNFTVPFHSAHATRARVSVRGSDEIVHKLPPVFHGDPLRESGSLVAVDYGNDIPVLLQQCGYRTTSVEGGVWYDPDATTWIESAEDYDRYKAAVQSHGMLEYFRYNSVVFVAEKISLPFTGERFVPELKGQLAHEHFHRYAVARDFVRGKAVLDIASGEGYGSSLLAEWADAVTGVDISEESIVHAKVRYSHQANLRFLTGSCEAIPCPDRSFDVAVSFETIEHITRQEGFLKEIRRVLTDDGLFIVSTPNIDVYKHDGESQNPYHQRELSLTEFRALLQSEFPSIRLFGQRVALDSQIWPLDGEEATAWKSYRRADDTIVAGSEAPFAPEYFVAVCSVSGESIPASASAYGDTSDDLTADYHARGAWGQSLDRELRQARAELVRLKSAPAPHVPDHATMRLHAKELAEQFRDNEAVAMLQRIITEDPSDVEAMLDLATIGIRRRDLTTASTIINHLLSVDPSNRRVMEALRALSIRETSRRNSDLPLSIRKYRSFEEYRSAALSVDGSASSTSPEHASYANLGRRGIDGHCFVCDDDVVFAVTGPGRGDEEHPSMVNWRETLVCPRCGLNNRMRAAVHLFETVVRPGPEASIYLAEQSTPLYRLLKGRYHSVVGSEFLGSSFTPGSTDSRGLRHEDLCHLSFASGSLDAILTFDVFEHVPDYEKAFRECLRALKPGGTMLFSVPFERSSVQTIVRAVLRPDGTLDHRLPPEYHGDPVQPESGCLCYQVFGWDMLACLKRMGFSTVEALGYQSHEFAYLGGEQLIFLAKKERQAEAAPTPKASAISMKPIEVWEKDPKFNAAMRAVPFTLVDKQRCFMLYQFALQSLGLDGQYAEIGVYKGGTAKILATVLEGMHKDLHLFDTFEGMPETDARRDLHHKGDFADTSLESVQRIVGSAPSIHYYKGFFPATAGPIRPHRFSFVHIDVDIYQSVLDSCEFFYTRMTPGGIMLFDDYGFESCPGAKQAVDEFFADKVERPCYLPTGQCVVTKR